MGQSHRDPRAYDDNMRCPIDSPSARVKRSPCIAACVLGCLVLGCSGDKSPANPSGSGGGAGVDGTGGAAGDTGGISGQTVGGTSSAATTGTSFTGSLSDRYPDETSLVGDPSVLFHDDFEQGWGKWDAPTKDTQYLFIETTSGLAHGGSRFLRSTVTEAELAAQQYISSSPRVAFPKRVDTVYWRFYARFKGISPTPHHWVRLSAGTSSYSSSGLANTVPPGDQGFWFDFDANIDDIFNFYVYWYKMRSGRCNDGSTTPGCAGDQGTTYHYGNNFQPPNQQPMLRDSWFCIEITAKANGVGTSDGALAFAINGKTIGDYRRGYPDGTWLRDSFHTGGCTFSACTAPVPFEGFDFRSSADVQFKELFMDAYYERDTTSSKRAELTAKGLTVLSEQTIYYDDIVVATEPIGCGKF
jgi:hypothetical protein